MKRETKYWKLWKFQKSSGLTTKKKLKNLHEIDTFLHRYQI